VKQPIRLQAVQIVFSFAYSVSAPHLQMYQIVKGRLGSSRRSNMARMLSALLGSVMAIPIPHGLHVLEL